MDCFFSRCSVSDTRVSLFARPTSLVSRLSCIYPHSIVLTAPNFHFGFVRNPPIVLISSKRISFQAIPIKQSQLDPAIQEMRQRRHNAMENFLLQECDISSSEIRLLISRDPSLFRRKSTDKAHQIAQMLRDCGFTVEQVRKIIISNPRILTLSVIQLKTIIEYLKTLGLAEEDLNHICSCRPRIFGDSLDRTLAPRILFLINFFGSKANLLKAFKKAPAIVSCNVEHVNSKLKVLENAGLLEHEVKRILVKDPRFLVASVGKIEKNMEFLTCTLGFKPNVVVEYPVLINLSVEKRMRPRYKVLQYLNLLGARNDAPRVASLLKLTEEDFVQRFLSSSTEVKILYEKYKGKTADVEVPELLLIH